VDTAVYGEVRPRADLGPQDYAVIMGGTNEAKECIIR
jgi:hypothetical protein